MHDEITNILENWTPRKRYKDESHAEVATFEYLKHYVPRTKYPACIVFISTFFAMFKPTWFHFAYRSKNKDKKKVMRP